MSRAPRGAAFAALLALASACANVAERQQADLAHASAELTARLGDAWPGEPRRAEASEVRAAIDALLAAPLDEDAAVRIALLAHPRVRAALEDLGIASAELVESGLLRNPVLSAAVLDFDAGTDVQIGLAQPLLELVLRGRRRDVARAELDAAHARALRELVGLAFDARRAFVRARAAERVVELERENARAAALSAELMRGLRDAGNATELALAVEDTNASHARLALLRAQSDARLARGAIDALLGLPDAEYTLRDEPPSPRAAMQAADTSRFADATTPTGASIGVDAPTVRGTPRATETLESAELERRALAASLELTELRAHARAAARRTGIDAWERALRDAEVGVEWQHSADLDESALGPTLQVGLPVFDAGDARRAVARGLARAALAREAALALDVRAAARALRERVQAASERCIYIAATHRVELARLTAETLKHYNAMQIGAFDVFRAKELERRSAREALESETAARLAELDLHELLAGRLRRRDETAHERALEMELETELAPAREEHR